MSFHRDMIGTVQRMTLPRRPLQVRRRRAPNASTEQGGTQNRFLDALHDLMIERDTLDIAVGDVARRLDLNHALVGYYFGNKEGMLMALLRRGTENTPQWLDYLLSTNRTPAEKLTVHLRGMVNSYAETPVIGVLTDFLLKTGSSKTVEDVTQLIVRPLTNFYERVVREGVDKSAFRAVDPMFLHMQIVGTCNFLFFNRERLRIGYGVTQITPALRNQYLQFLTDSILRSVSLQPENPPQAPSLPVSLA
jgi:TetR/AcrR family transcriptional regulator